MSFTSEQKDIARCLASGAPICQAYSIHDNIYTEQFADTPEGAYKALEVFVGYAHARQGVDPNYERIAKDVIKEIFGNKIEKQITTDTAEEAWKKYQEIAKDKYNIERNKHNELKLNESRNPMNDDGGVLAKLAEKQEVHNLANYVREQIQRGKIEEAHEFIDFIRGVGPKIASFYLRDIVYLAKIDENKISNAHLLQPIDIWLDRTLSIIFGNEVLEKLDDKQKIIVELCKEAECSSIEFNQGAWTIGSQIAGDFASFKNI